MQVVPLYDHGDQLIAHHKSQDHTGNRDNDGLGEIAHHRKNVGVPALRGLTHLIGNAAHTGIDVAEHAVQTVRDAADQECFDPVRESVKDKLHGLSSGDWRAAE